MNSCDKPPVLFYSGGVDSTTIALSLKKTEKSFSLIHMSNLINNTGIRRNHKVFENVMSFHFAKEIDVPILFVPSIINSSPFDVCKQLDILEFISGDGMDRCYGYLTGSGKEREATFGEDFHVFFPLVDKILKTIPTRYKYYMTKYSKVDDIHNAETLKKTTGVNVVKFSLHPLFIKFFENYKHNVKDIVYPKLLTYLYVKEYLGTSYYSYCKKILKLHKNELDPFFYRFITHIIDNGMTFDANKLDKIYRIS